MSRSSDDSVSHDRSSDQSTAEDADLFAAMVRVMRRVEPPELARSA
jgi:hypothetical protein